MKSELVWWPEKGWGFLSPTEQHPYDNRYFEHCQEQEKTPVGRSLINLRWSMVMQCSMQQAPGKQLIVDVGVGGGGFVERTGCKGFDINPHAAAMLRESGRWHDLPTAHAPILCFWDSLEHILVPEKAVAQATHAVFVSLPIFESAEHAINSKHYKPNEHLWYFTERGLIRWMREQGLSLLERNRDEERYGRDGIGSYCFIRR